MREHHQEKEQSLEKADQSFKKILQEKDEHIGNFTFSSNTNALTQQF